MFCRIIIIVDRAFDSQLILCEGKNLTILRSFIIEEGNLHGNELRILGIVESPVAQRCFCSVSITVKIFSGHNLTRFHYFATILIESNDISGFKIIKITVVDQVSGERAIQHLICRSRSCRRKHPTVLLGQQFGRGSFLSTAGNTN